jgi:hypothetical protein
MASVVSRLLARYSFGLVERCGIYNLLATLYFLTYSRNCHALEFRIMGLGKTMFAQLLFSKIMF